MHRDVSRIAYYVSIKRGLVCITVHVHTHTLTNTDTHTHIVYHLSNNTSDKQSVAHFSTHVR